MERTALLNHYVIGDKVNIVILNDENHIQDKLGYHQLCMYFWIKKENFFLIKGNKYLNLNPIEFLKSTVNELDKKLKYCLYIIDSDKELGDGIKDSITQFIVEEKQSEVEYIHYVTKEERSTIMRQPSEVVYKSIIVPLLEERNETGRFDGFALTLNQLALKYESLRDKENNVDKFRIQNLIEKYDTYHKLLTLFNVDIELKRVQHIDFTNTDFDEIMKIMVSISEPLSSIAEDVF